jgi:hypothetical protein
MWNGCVKEHKRASKGMRSESSESRDLSRFDQYNLIDEEEEKVDELQRYLDAPTVASSRGAISTAVEDGI